MSVSKTARRITAACEECGRATGSRAVTTEDGYTFQRQPDNTWTDGDMTFGSLDEIEEQVGIASIGPGEDEHEEPSTGRQLCLDCWQEGNSVCAGCEEPFPHAELSPDEAARVADPANMTEQGDIYCPKCLADLDQPFSRRPGRRLQASRCAAKAIDGIGAGLRAAVEREAMWRSTLRENYDNDFGQWLEYSDMYGLAKKLGFATAEEAWEANPTIQGSTDPQDFRVVPDGEHMDLELNAALGWDPCEDCGSNEEPCDCRRRAEARQPELARAVKAARESLDMGDLVIKESPPSMGGLDIYSKGPGYAEDRGDLEKVTFLNERGMEELGEWITNAGRVASSLLRVDRSDDCVWLVDERETAQEIHMTPDQATAAGEALLEAGGSPSSSLSLPIATARRIAILAPDETGRLVRRPPAKPMSVDRDVDTGGMELETCPRCKGHGGVFPADEGEDCNLCDGSGEVFRHPDGSYSNEMDRNTYLY